MKKKLIMISVIMLCFITVGSARMGIGQLDDIERPIGMKTDMFEIIPLMPYATLEDESIRVIEISFRSLYYEDGTKAYYELTFEDGQVIFLKCPLTIEI